MIFIALMRAVRADVFRETHQYSRSRHKIGQGKVYYRDTACVTKVYLGSRISDADKKKIDKALSRSDIVVKPMTIDKYFIAFEDETE